MIGNQINHTISFVHYKRIVESLQFSSPIIYRKIDIPDRHTIKSRSFHLSLRHSNRYPLPRIKNRKETEIRKFASRHSRNGYRHIPRIQITICHVLNKRIAEHFGKIFSHTVIGITVRSRIHIPINLRSTPARVYLRLSESPVRRNYRYPAMSSVPVGIRRNEVDRRWYSRCPITQQIGSSKKVTTLIRSHPR